MKIHSRHGAERSTTLRFFYGWVPCNHPSLCHQGNSRRVLADMQQRSNENLANFRKHIFEGLRINSVKSEATKMHISMTHSRVKMNSTNWPTPNLRVFIAQMVEHYSANTEAMGLNPVEVNLQLLKLQLLLRRSYLNSNLCFRSSRHLH